jgi:hypothetical protein
MHDLLNETLCQFRETARVEQPLMALAGQLHSVRSERDGAQWRQWIERELRPHSLYRVLLEDPFVRHSAERPRGYPGDAELLDYIYGSADVRPKVAAATDLGRQLYGFSNSTPAPAAVRHRLSITAAEIERMAAGGARPHILSIACGHLREAPSLPSLHEGRLGRLVALDQDPLSVQRVRAECAHLGVEAHECSARKFIRGACRGSRFDFIYALGLYDYLSDETGRRLLAAAVDMLNPGGKVWIANFVEDLWSTAYMEAVMDWWLVYRSEERLTRLAEGLDPAKVASQRLFREPADHVAFLEIVRA